MTDTSTKFRATMRRSGAFAVRYDKLTPRERRVASLIATGLTNCDIADTLRIARGTVKTHRRNINRKLGMTLPRFLKLATRG